MRRRAKVSEGFEAGTMVGDVYRVIGLLGRGGQGHVYLAEDARLSRSVALKVIRVPRDAPSAARDRLVREARAMARVVHPNVVRVFEYLEHAGRPVLVMERVGGVSLAERLEMAEGAPLPMAEAAHLAESICRGVQAIHEAGLLHADLKPANVIVGRGGQIVITDFGLTSWLRPRRGRRPRIVGTPRYIAPEVATGARPSGPEARRVDVFGVGLVMHEVLTGRLPFAEGKNVVEQLGIQARASFVGMPETSDELEDVVRCALSRDPTGRPESAEALGFAFARAFAPTLPRPGSASAEGGVHEAR